MKNGSERVSDFPQGDLPQELRSLVKLSVASLGNILRSELGDLQYRRIESVRKRMASIRSRSVSSKKIANVLQSTYREFERLSSEERYAVARAYTLMFELINACENAYRTSRLRSRKPSFDEAQSGAKSDAEGIHYVVTAHPTEARAPSNIEVFHRIQALLVQSLERGFQSIEEELATHLRAAWRIRIVRYRKPRVSDEAEHIYSVVLREENLDAILDFGMQETPVFLRSWVGGDKDGHPGVDAVAMEESLALSRGFLVDYALRQIESASDFFHLVPGSSAVEEEKELKSAIRDLRELQNGDGARVSRAAKALRAWRKRSEKDLKSVPLPLRRLNALFSIFQGMVVPLELREDSSVILSDPTGKTLAIGKMLARVSDLAKGGDPRWYARGMIVSMADSLEHIQVTAKMVRRITRSESIPVVPLFEQRAALEKSPVVMESVFRDRELMRVIRKNWNGRFQIMLGYSDSSKEAGVLSSRLEVSRAMNALDRVFKKHRVKPIFFHGSGGSIDRGGGSVLDQIASWPKSALVNYKATIQGEMVERTFASPEIARSRFRKIAESASRIGTSSVKPSRELESFKDRVEAKYRETIASPSFLSMVEQATPYRYLNALKIGSRPSKRAGALSVPALRAIPWVLCWTQTRVLMQTWWGVGSAWAAASSSERKALRAEFKRNPLFRTYMNALGFTLAKVELPVWEFYLDRSGLPAKEAEGFKAMFREEFASTWKCFQSVTGEKDPLWYRPWLGKSIELRAPLIHPLNLLGIIAQEEKDLPLVRMTVTGIASGMMTTG